MDRDQLKVVLHYTANRPRPDVMTTVVSVTSSRSQTLSDVRFEARIRDEDVSGCEFSGAFREGESTVLADLLVDRYLIGVFYRTY